MDGEGPGGSCAAPQPAEQLGSPPGSLSRAGSPGAAPEGDTQRDRTGSLSRACGGEEPAPAPSEAPRRFSPQAPSPVPAPLQPLPATGTAFALVSPPLWLYRYLSIAPHPFRYRHRLFLLRYRFPPPPTPPPGPQLPARPRGSRSAAPALPRDPAAAAGRRKDGDETCSAAGECRGKHGGGLGVRPTHTPPPPPRTRGVPPRGPLPQPGSGPSLPLGLFGQKVL